MVRGRVVVRWGDLIRKNNDFGQKTWLGSFFRPPPRENNGASARPRPECRQDAGATFHVPTWCNGWRTSPTTCPRVYWEKRCPKTPIARGRQSRPAPTFLLIESV